MINTTTTTLTKDTTFEEWLRAENSSGRGRLAWAANTQKAWEEFQASFNAPAPSVTFTAIIEVCTDDDFHLEIAGKTIHHNGVIYSPKCSSLEEAMSEVAKMIQGAKIVWAKTWSMTNEKGTTAGNYADRWTCLSDEALDAMKIDSEWYEDYKLYSGMPELGVPNFYKGGNQTIEISFHQI